MGSLFLPAEERDTQVFANRVSHPFVFNKKTCRVVAIGMLAFPDPLVSTAAGVILLAVSFALPEPNPRQGMAPCCRCDFHRQATQEHRVLGNGALIQERRLVAPKLSAHAQYLSEAYGFGPIAPALNELAGTLHSDTSIRRDTIYSWHKLPKLEGALLRRLGNFDGKAAVRCELSRA